MDKSRKGDIAEMRAVAWLWERGYEVYYNLGSTGAADLVIKSLETGELMEVDVKTVSPGKNPKTGYVGAKHGPQRDEGVTLLYSYKGQFAWHWEDLPLFVAALKELK